jgi:photosystem II stability/assembly factor-like uncharacterized protein
MMLDDPRDRALYAALNLGHFGVKLRRSRDDGATWEELEGPVFPPQPEGAEGPPWKLVQIWALETGTRDEPGVLWAGTIPGGLFRTEDHGTTWHLVRPLWDRPERLQWMGGGYDAPGIHSIVVDPRDGKRVTVGISCGGVWQTEDGGDSWRNMAHGMRAAFMPPDQQGDPNIQDPHRVVASRVQPDTLWSQHHCGIFRRTAGSTLWTEINSSPVSNFGFAVAVHPADANTAWFVPAASDARRVPVDARLVVNRTRDGGRTFETLSAGLPQEACYDLVYRHGLDVDSTGGVLAMGSTSGSLWVSANQGDSWQCAAANLPPIYAVRFSE